MKMRFWQRTYIFTLVLFLVCMNTGILSLTVYTYRKNVEAVETAVKAEQYYVAMNFERDFDDLGTENASPSLLMKSFGTYYGNKGILIAFEDNGEAIYSNFKAGFKTDVAIDSMVHTEYNGKRHILISSAICDGKYELIFAKDVSELDEEYRRLMVTFALIALSVSLLLAAALYFILKKLSEPLERLKKTTEVIQSGDYTVTAKESGNNDEFTLLARSFNSMIAKINEQMRALELDAERKQMLVDNLAHELRTPLTSIHGYAEYLEKAATSEEMRIDAARYIMSESERLQKISEILLDSAFIRGNKPEMAELDVSVVLYDVADKLKIKAENRGVKLICDAESLIVSGNETLLSMLFYNLTDNAIKACGDNGRVVLSIEDNSVSVCDNGKGMTAEQLLHITEPFYRTDKSRARAEGGAGLGLALCKQIADTHGITLSFESEVGKGTKAFAEFTSLK